MMDFEEFTQQVAEEIKRFLPSQYEDASISLQKVTKNNDMQLTGIMIRTEENYIAPNIYLEQFYEQYQDGRNLDDILRDIADVRVKRDIGKDFDVNMITDLEQVRDHIICKLVNAVMNAEYLANKPHTRVEDLAVVYAVDLGGSKDGHMTAAVTDSLLEMYGISKEKLHDIALHNLAESKIEFKTMRDVLINMMFPDGIPENDPRSFMIPPEEEHPSMYVLSNSNTLNGAAALLDAKTMEDISRRLGGDFIVLPSSVHEVIVLPADVEMDRCDLEAMVQDVNAGKVAPEDRLSDHVYMYDSKEKELVLADRMEERKQQREQEQNHEKAEERAGRSDKADRTERKPERERVSMKELLSEKKAEVAKNESGREHPVAKKTRETAR